MNMVLSTDTGKAGDERLLVVDPNTTLRTLRAEVLRLKGYQVDTAATIEDALLKLDGERYAAVLMSGSSREVKQWGERVRASRPEQLVIVVATPLSHFPPGSCPDLVIGGDPQTLLDGINAALKPH